MRLLDLERRVVELMQAGRPFVRARLVSARGSVPQQTGATMLVHPDGQIEGTIGGGRFEAMVIFDAVQLLEGEGEPVRLQSYDLTREQLGMYCAGQATVLLEGWRPTDRLIVFGGGHVGQALGRIAAQMGTFHVTVVDDRPEFAGRERHPTVDQVILTDEAYQRDRPPCVADAYAVVVTRCHDVDRRLIKALVEAPLAYLGMIGSQAKVRRMWMELKREGVSAEALGRIHAPIGLKLGGKAPGEIAISILAQILQVRDQQRSEPTRAPSTLLTNGDEAQPG